MHIYDNSGTANTAWSKIAKGVTTNRYVTMEDNEEGVQTTNRFAAFMNEYEDEEPATWNGYAALADEEIAAQEEEWNEMMEWADEDPHNYYHTTQSEWEAL